MRRLFLKLLGYGFLMLVALELLVRLFYLGKDTPIRIVDENGVEKWQPVQNGFSVTGNRRQNFSAYHINNSGFNSYREYLPTKEKKEIALVGDSFIEGFHQNYYSSTGRKIEQKLPRFEVYEYGYAGYDMADQLHLIHAYKEKFDLIDHVVIGVKFSNDLRRSEYQISQERIKLENPRNRLLKKSKLLVYTQSIGLLDPALRMGSDLINLLKGKSMPSTLGKGDVISMKSKDSLYLNNFEMLVQKYGFDKDRFVLLLDKDNTSSLFTDYLEANDFSYIDFSKTLKESKKPATLIYDMHWNNHGRNLIAGLIAEYISNRHRPEAR
ncbi:hypothetical protein LV716_18075 [Flagellimonas sp. HMM57]|uniref:hypothetical protein n=1 Tax=unclassified Flagellimonas TaxID=2644544 RepID=UPI0013D52680|nr:MULTISPECIES: hypothetical protein [unclassified Flagellimonas]UII76150.1 hypothetical protein LV716_18075 [Flagellimonas sp. HMM57]